MNFFFNPMQSTIRVPTSNSPFNKLNSKWEKHCKVQIFLPIKKTPCSKRIPNSLKTSFQFNFEEEKLNKEPELTKPILLPVVIRQCDGVSQYFWDGNDLTLVAVHEKPFAFDNLNDLGDGFQRVFRSCSLGVRNFLLPRKFNENYLEYVKWKSLHREFSSALQVLATQAMFRVIGIRYDRSLPSAADLGCERWSWTIK